MPHCLHSRHPGLDPGPTCLRTNGPSRATEILQRKRALTLPMIRKIAREWHVPERLLVGEYAVRR